MNKKFKAFIILVFLFALISCDMGGPKHVHTYVGEKRECECGAVDPGVVAYVKSAGNKVKARFLSLDEAIQYVINNSTQPRAIDNSNTIYSSVSSITCANGLNIPAAEIGFDFSDTTVTINGASGLVVNGGNVIIKGKQITADTIRVSGGSLKTEIDYSGTMSVDASAGIEINSGSVIITGITQTDLKSLGHASANIVINSPDVKFNLSANDCKDVWQYISENSSVSKKDIKINNHDHHNWTAESVIKETTCTENGQTLYVCTDCGVEDLRTMVSSGHDTSPSSAKKASCTAPGNIEYWYCSKCHQYFTDEDCTQTISASDLVIPATGHTKQHTQDVAATCTESGNNEYWYCTTCDKYYSDIACLHEAELSDLITSPTGHKCDHVNAKDPTCTERGNCEYWYCSLCNQYFTEESCTHAVSETDVFTPSTGHKTEHTDALNATCTEAGHIEYWYCSQCKQYFADKECTQPVSSGDLVAAPKGHSIKHVPEKAPTCTEEGNIEYWYCSTCDKYFDNESCTQEISGSLSIAIDPDAHDWGQWETVVPADHINQGSETRVCKHSGSHTQTRDILPYGDHSFSEQWTYDDDKHWHVAVCGHDLISGEGLHIWNEGTVTTEPSCTEAGVRTFTCTVCGKTRTEEISATGHDKKYYASNAATCTESGNIEYWYCSSCEQYFTDELCTQSVSETDLIIHSTGHSLDHTASKSPTCTESGNIEYWYCPQCKQYFTDRECTQVVSKTDLIIPYTGHSTVPTASKSPTCTQSGNIEYWYCSQCKQYFTDELCTNTVSPDQLVLPPSGHTTSHTEAKAATCTESGNIEYWHCTTCGQYFRDKACLQPVSQTDLAIQLLGHDWNVSLSGKHYCSREDCEYHTPHDPHITSMKECDCECHDDVNPHLIGHCSVCDNDYAYPTDTEYSLVSGGFFNISVSGSDPVCGYIKTQDCGEYALIWLELTPGSAAPTSAKCKYNLKELEKTEDNKYKLYYNTSVHKYQISYLITTTSSGFTVKKTIEK